MKPAPFDYVAPGSLSEAIDILDGDPDAKVLAGGQSLMPLLALRLARPSVLVDIARLGLDGIAVPGAANGTAVPGAANGTVVPGAADGFVVPGAADGFVELGAFVRHRRLETDPALADAAPLLVDAARQVGYPAIRNRGTLGGSLAHADPAAELPAAVVALEGSVVAAGPAGERVVPAADLADGFLTTTLADAEILTSVRVRPAGPRHGAAFCESAGRDHDFADAGVGVALELGLDGRPVWVGAAACGLGGRPLPLAEVLREAGVGEATASPGGAPPGDGPAPGVLRAVAAGVEAAAAGAGADEDRAALAGLLAARALRRAWQRAGAAMGMAA